MKVFSVYDSKVETYSTPFFLRSKGEAMRTWVDIANDKSSDIGKHPEDYTLFEIGEWDQNTAKIQNHNTPVSLGVAIEFTRKEN